MSTSAWCPLENVFVCLHAYDARKYSGAAKLERRCFWGLHVSFVISFAPLHLFSWHS